MTVHIASAREQSRAFIPESSIIGCRYNAFIKVDQVCIIGTVPLGKTYAMWIMTGITGCPFVPDMFVVIIKRFVI
jgi:hypothetical protein